MEIFKTKQCLKKKRKKGKEKKKIKKREQEEMALKHVMLRGSQENRASRGNKSDKIIPSVKAFAKGNG